MVVSDCRREGSREVPRLIPRYWTWIPNTHGVSLVGMNGTVQSIEWDGYKSPSFCQGGGLSDGTGWIFGYPVTENRIGCG